MEQLPPSRADRHPRPVTTLGRARDRGLPPRIWRLRSAGQQHSLYHAGDTAYFSGFREIGQRLAPELALLPIGAYNPASFRNVHASPADATRAFLDLNSRWMVPMHYGTFRSRTNLWTSRCNCWKRKPRRRELKTAWLCWKKA